MSEGQQAPQRVLVPTQATIDASMLEYINEISGFVPEEVREEWWGFANRQVRMSRFTPRQSEAVIMRAANMVDFAMMSMPIWKVTPKMIMNAENFIALVKELVWAAVTLDPTNERGHVSKTAGGANGQPMTPQEQVPRKPTKPFWKIW